MFVGHYGLAFAARRVTPSVPLWVFFVAVQLVDILWALFVLAGIEHVRIVPGFTSTNPLDFYHFPYTHGLVTTAGWAILGYVAWRFMRRDQAGRAALVIALAIFSHWVLDFIVHTPDLPIWDDTAKVGLGLWNIPVLAFALELVFLAGGLFWYLRGGAARPKGMIVFAIAMVALHAATLFGPPPPSPAVVAGSGFFGYIVLAAVAAWLERRRT